MIVSIIVCGKKFDFGFVFLILSCGLVGVVFGVRVLKYFLCEWLIFFIGIILFVVGLFIVY